MASWHKRARIGIAVFGCAVAALVYVAMGQRQTAPPPAAVERLDPKAVLETTTGLLQRITGIQKDFEILSSTSQTYADGSTRHADVTIVVRKEDGRTFTVTAREALSGPDETVIELLGDVRLEDSDGFALTADRATFHRADSVARAPGAVMFGRARMSGSGVGVTYDQAHDVLTILDQAQVATTDDAGLPVMQFSSGTATLDRVQHVLTLDGAVHVLRGEQVIDADRAVARLSEGDDVIRFVELRGNARVEGGESRIDAMSAQAIDLDYSDDGRVLEAVALTGTAAIAMAGQAEESQQIVAESAQLRLAADGASQMVLTEAAEIAMTAADGRQGRRIGGEMLDLEIASDGSLTRAVGRENVRLDLPAADAAPQRTIHARTLDGGGEAGKGLTRATFTGDVVFSEAARAGGGSGPAAAAGARTARAQRLEAAFADDAVTAATFTGAVTFEEAGLKACAGQLVYQTGKGTLQLSGATAEGNPIVAEEEIAVEALAIDVALEGRRMEGRGSVRTHLGTPARCRPATSRAAGERRASRLPGLLDAGTAATVTAAALEYDGDAGSAVYTGRAVLTQGETAIHADTITIDRANGDLIAVGQAISTMRLDGDTSTGRAYEIRYVEKERRITYASVPRAARGAAAAPPAASPAAPAGARAAAAGAAPGRGLVGTEPQLSAPFGDLRAGRIAIVLAEDGDTAERVEAETNVRLTLGGRTITGGTRLTYDPSDQRYVVNGDGASPVRVVERTGGSCREMRGRSLIYDRANDTIVVDGNNLNRTQSAPGACPATTR